MRVIIVGAGRVGRSICEQLCRENHDIVVIDSDANKINTITTEADVMGIVGNGASYYVQKEAGIDDANLLIAVTGSDEVNLLCCLFAQKSGNVETIARVRNHQYREELGYIKEELGLALTINPEYAAACEISRILRFPLASKVDTFAGGRIELLNLSITADSVLCNHSLIEIAGMTKSQVLICAVERAGEVIIPNGSFVIEENDKVSIIASKKDARQFFKRIGYDTHQVKNAMIIGGGKITYYLAEELIKAGIEVKIIEKERGRCEELSELIPKASIINGDAAVKDVLLEEGIEKAGAVVTLAKMDETNVFISLYANNVSKAKVVTKVNRADFDNIIKTFNLDSIIRPKDITTDYIVSYVRARQKSIGSSVETIYSIINNKAEALEFEIIEGMSAISKPLRELHIKKNLLVGAIIRDDKVMIANGDSTIECGDRVVVISGIKGFHDFNDIFEV